MRYLKIYFSALIIFLFLDFLWLGILMPEFYNDQLGSLARRAGNELDVIWWSAAVVYLFIPAGLIWFVLPKRRVFLWGCLFGIILYGVYDFTNYATLAGWPIALVVVDTLWGGIVCGTTSFISGLVTRKK